MSIVQKRKKVLVVDDELGIRELLSEILADEGYAVVAAHDAQSAWEARRREDLDIILLDIWMPGVDGFALYKQWKDANLADVPVIIMSGHATVDTAVEATRMGALEVLEKPIAIHRLLAAIEKGLMRKKQIAVSPYLAQLNFGKTAVANKFKTDLEDAYADSGHILFVGAPNSGGGFFAQFLMHPKGKVVYIESGATLEKDIDKLLAKSAPTDLYILRLINVYNPSQLSGLTGFLCEASRAGIRAVACSAEAPEALRGKPGFNDMLVSMLSRRVILMPSLAACRADLPYFINVISRWFVDSPDLYGRALTDAAKDALAKHIYEDDFLELIGIIRSALLYAQESKIDEHTIRVIITQRSRFSCGGGLADDIYTMTLRDARDAFEREYFSRLINITNGNMQKAAEIAGLDRTYFYRKLKQYRADSKIVDSAD